MFLTAPTEHTFSLCVVRCQTSRATFSLVLVRALYSVFGKKKKPACARMFFRQIGANEVPAIPDRVWEMLTDDEASSLRMMLDGWRHEPRVTCPSCGTDLGIRLRISAGAVRVNPDGSIDKPEKIETVTAASNAGTPAQADAALIAAAADGGVLEAFGQAVKAAKQDQSPHDMAKFFLTFMKSCRAKAMPRGVVDRYVRFLATDNLEFWSAQGIVAVVADGIMRSFVPLNFLIGAPVYGVNKDFKGRISAGQDQLEGWVKGRFGYVPAESKTFMGEMRRKSLGDFCEFVQ